MRPSERLPKTKPIDVFNFNSDSPQRSSTLIKKKLNIVKSPSKISNQSEDIAIVKHDTYETSTEGKDLYKKSSITYEIDWEAHSKIAKEVGMLISNVDPLKTVTSSTLQNDITLSEKLVISTSPYPKFSLSENIGNSLSQKSSSNLA